jgi:hypothetical protein
MLDFISDSAILALVEIFSGNSFFKGQPLNFRDMLFVK